MRAHELALLPVHGLNYPSYKQTHVAHSAAPQGGLRRHLLPVVRWSIPAPHSGKPQTAWRSPGIAGDASRPINNRPQVGNLPHKNRRSARRNQNVVVQNRRGARRPAEKSADLTAAVLLYTKSRRISALVSRFIISISGRRISPFAQPALPRFRNSTNKA